MNSGIDKLTNTTTEEPIYITKTFMPPLEEYLELVKEIWASHLVTNDGPLFQRFEQDLRDYTKVDHLVCLGNGTWALQLAVRALELEGEVITTPFTHIASAQSLFWERCTPVFVDIDPLTLNIDPGKIEEKITDKTSGILAVPVYSNPVDFDRIEAIAQRHQLKTIYDCAHAFGAEYKGRSVFAYGDLSMASFNATKGMHTMEGAALFARDAEMETQIRKLAYFGMDKNKYVTQEFGTNAKLIELCAAMGIVNLRYFDAGVKHKGELYNLYRSRLEQNDRISFQRLTDKINYSYMPIILSDEDYKRELISTLNHHKIYPREYFDRSLETVFGDKVECPIAYDITRRILCLPISDYLTTQQVERICSIINEV